MKKPCYFGRFNSLGHTAEACQKLWKALTIGVLVLLFGGCWLARLAAKYFADLRMPDALRVAASALLLLATGVIAPTLPAARASRVDVIQALRSE